MYYQVRLKYPDITDKSVTEDIICEALSFAEAEAITQKAMQNIQNADFLDITHIKRLPRLMEVYNDHEGEFIYKVVVYRMYIDEQSHKEKKIKYDWILWADSVDHANRKANEYLKQGYDDIHLDSVSTTKLTQIILYR